MMTRTLFVGALAAAVAVWPAPRLRAQAPPPAPLPSAHELAGGWTLNKDLSDLSPAPDANGEGQQGRGRRGGGFGGPRGGFGGGGFGGGFGRGGYGGGRGESGGMNQEDRQRMREAMRQIMAPADHLVITDSADSVVITTGDGDVTRLATDGSKVKDESTKIERQTKWDGDKLVSQITGLGRGKMTQAWQLDPEHHRLTETITMENPRSKTPRVLTRVYDADAAGQSPQSPSSSSSSDTPDTTNRT